jgi:SNF2 family DNA or RNA helicase
LRRFRQEAGCQVLLSNPSTLGEGVSLHHACHDAIYVDRDFAAGRFLQSIDRIHRLGLPLDTETTATVLVASNTIDEVVERRLAIKLRFLGTILDDPAVLELGELDEEPTTGAGLDAADLIDLFQHLSSSPSAPA